MSPEQLEQSEQCGPERNAASNRKRCCLHAIRSDESGPSVLIACLAAGCSSGSTPGGGNPLPMITFVSTEMVAPGGTALTLTVSGQISLLRQSWDGTFLAEFVAASHQLELSSAAATL